ncbi:MAG: zinc ribbon domain-containing protein [Thermodesulfobacteriota bacterium]
MQKQILLLEQIQKIDLDIQEMEAESNSYPLEIEQFSSELDEEKIGLVETEETLDELVKRGKALEGELELYRDKIKSWENQLNQATNEKEYRAFLKEINETKKANLKREEDILEIMENTEKIAGEIAKKREELQESILRFENIKKDLAEKKNGLYKELEGKKKSRMKLVKETQPNVLKRYESIKGAQKVAVVPARDGTCLGCYMSIPPQTFIQVQRRGMIVNCPHCNRILFWKEN